MAEIYEINTFIEVPLLDGEYLGNVVAEMLIETEGEQWYLTATYAEGLLGFGATRQSLMWYYTKTDDTVEEDRAQEIFSTEIEGYLCDEEEIKTSIFAKQYRKLAEMVIEKILECGIADEEEVDELKFWEN